LKTFAFILVIGVLGFVFIAGNLYGPPDVKPAPPERAVTTQAALDPSPRSTGSVDTSSERSTFSFPPPATMPAPVEQRPTRPDPEAVAQLARTFYGIAPAEAASMVAAHRGSPTLVVIYSATCSRSQALLRDINEGRQVGMLPEVLAFSLEGGGLPAPFSTQPIRSYAPGELDRAMATVGIQVGSTFLQPLVAVLDSEGRLVAEWQGLTSVGPIQQVVATSRL